MATTGGTWKKNHGRVDTEFVHSFISILLELRLWMKGESNILILVQNLK